MKQKLIIANWKSQMHINEAKMWLFTLSKEQELLKNTEKLLIVCPPFTLLSYVHDFIKANDLTIKVGAQNISPYDEGPYTGEIAATQVKEYAEYVVIGHSERRQYFGESKELLEKKVTLANKAELNTIYCINDDDLSVPLGVAIVAYEPKSAIGTGEPANPQHVFQISEKVLNGNTIKTFLYGGSVTSSDVKNYTQDSSQIVSGVLVGGASLVADEFLQIVKNA